MTSRMFTAIAAATALLWTAQAVSRDEMRAMCAKFPNSTLTIGMVTKGNTELTLQRWRPTFEGFLTNSTKSYGCYAKLVPLQFDTYTNMTRDKKIDYIFPNPTGM